MFTFLPSRLSDYLCGLTFHTEFGATAVFVDENEKDEEEDTSEACQAHSDGNLGEMKRCVINWSNPGTGNTEKLLFFIMF